MNTRSQILALLMLAAHMAFADGSKVTFRDDHTVLVDDQPFFPIGLYYCYEEFEDTTGKQLAALKEMGFNTLGFYRYGEPTDIAELDRAHNLGLKVWVRGVNGFSIDSPELEQSALKQLRALRSHPSLLLWEFQDEPLYNKISVENSRKGQELIRKEDPNHPILTIECPVSVARIREWNGLGDAYGVDLYPIPPQQRYGRLPNRDITQVRDYIQAIRAARGDGPILLVLQAWSWNPLDYGKRGFPTPVQSRFMAYQAVIHGAKGLHYYGQVHCTKPNSAANLYSTATDPAVQQAEFAKCVELNRWFWEQHRPLFRELSEATPIFVLRDAKPDLQIRPVGDAPTIESVTKQAGDELYLLAANAADARRGVTFQLPKGTRVSRIHVLFENRTLAVKDGVFTDTFEPYGTHVYGTTNGLPGKVNQP